MLYCIRQQVGYFGHQLCVQFCASSSTNTVCSEIYKWLKQCTFSFFNSGLRCLSEYKLVIGHTKV
jgi:hypothetical protein